MAEGEAMQEIKEELKQALKGYTIQGKITEQAIYQSIIDVTKQKMKGRDLITGDKKLYYISAEFLIGKMLTCNLINLGILDEVKAFVEENGCVWKTIQDMEAEPSLGNGGLGRLAACFMDSIASLQLCGDGIGLYYHFGLFEQQFKQNKQVEIPNRWIQEDTNWFTKTALPFKVEFPSFSLQPVRYDMDIVGYHGKRNTLHLFDIEGVDESIVKAGIEFDKKDIKENLTLFLYPDDSDDDGRKLRIYQQYFMVSCGAQMILHECKEKGYDLHTLQNHIAIQINDTHPSLIIPELIRLLIKEGILLKEAMHIVEQTCAYTNHTILAEALETWPMAYLQEVVPSLVKIIQSLDAVAYQRDKQAKTAIIDEGQRVHMAHMDIHFGKSVNGVAEIHTKILEDSELHDFYTLYPEKFNNKTNGITFRRWLYACNPQLTKFLCEQIGTDFLADAKKIEKLLQYHDDEAVLQRLYEIKQEKKKEWISHMAKKQGVLMNADAIFDTQVKRLHEYKRQQMNALYIIHKYLEIKAGKLPPRPICCIFGAKAAPAYTIAKDIIHVLLCLQDIITNDPVVSPHLQVCFIENYNITEAELVIPASDISEQISLASKEASGTGNMKFMLNGALTLGTRDGANVEIAQLVQHENIYLFGESSKQVIDHYQNQDYSSKAIYEHDEHIATLVDFLVGQEMTAVGDQLSLQRFYHELLTKDWFMTLLDLNDYITCKERMLFDYEDRKQWCQKMLVNIAKSAFFSSDRTITEYERDIWKLV